jgi:membrane protease YdiL (CAAX protease family)
MNFTDFKIQGTDSAFDKQSVKWKARDGFLCAVTLMIVSYATNEVLWVADRNSHTFAVLLYAHLNFTQGALMLTESIQSLLIVFLFAHTWSLREFFAKIGLSREPTTSGWFAAWLAIGIGILALYGVARQWIPPNHLIRSFFYQGGGAKWFIIVYGVLIAPFFEEVVRRGFLYQAFRGSYNIYLSIFFVLCVHAYFHWGIISHSFYTFGCLVLVEVLLCAIREWTGNVWNCVLFHAAYNATQSLPWYVCLVSLIIVLPYFSFRVVKNEKEVSPE